MPLLLICCVMVTNVLLAAVTNRCNLNAGEATSDRCGGFPFSATLMNICMLSSLISEGGEVTLASLLLFWTGAEQPPLTGFDQPLSIQFFSQEPGMQRLPSSSTCGLVLMLPRGTTDAEKFRNTMTFVLKNTYGFGKL